VKRYTVAKRVDQNIHSDPIAPNATAYGYHNCEEMTNKAKKSETLQQKPIRKLRSIMVSTTWNSE
jgi:hypothetical protein